MVQIKNITIKIRKMFDCSSGSRQISPTGWFFHAHVSDGERGETGRCSVHLVKFDEDEADARIFASLTRDDFENGRDYLERDYFGPDHFGDDGEMLDEVAWSPCGNYVAATGFFCNDTFIFRIVDGLPESLFLPDSAFPAIIDWSANNRHILKRGNHSLYVSDIVWSPPERNEKVAELRLSQTVRIKRRASVPEQPAETLVEREKVEYILRESLNKVDKNGRAVAGRLIRLVSERLSRGEIDRNASYLFRLMNGLFLRTNYNTYLSLTLDSEFMKERQQLYDNYIAAKARIVVKQALNKRTEPGKERAVPLTPEIEKRNEILHATSLNELAAELDIATKTLEDFDYVAAKYNEQWDSAYTWLDSSFSPDGSIVFSLLQQGYYAIDSQHERRTVVVVLCEFPSFRECFTYDLGILTTDQSCSHTWLLDNRSAIFTIGNSVHEIRYSTENSNYEFINHKLDAELVACNSVNGLIAITSDKAGSDGRFHIAIKELPDFEPVCDFSLEARPNSIRWNLEGNIVWGLCVDGTALRLDVN